MQLCPRRRRQERSSLIRSSLQRSRQLTRPNPETRLFLNYYKTNQHQIFFKTRWCIPMQNLMQILILLSNVVWIHELTNLWTVKVKRPPKDYKGRKGLTTRTCQLTWVSTPYSWARGVGSEAVILVLRNACRIVPVVVPARDVFCRFCDRFCEHDHITIMLDNLRKTVGFPSAYYLQFRRQHDPKMCEVTRAIILVLLNI